MTAEGLLNLQKDDLQQFSETLDAFDISQLIAWLSEKNDKIRYMAFLLLQYRSESSSDIHPYWDTFLHKCKSDNSYQRSIGLMLMAENAKWDTDNKMESSINDYLALLKDEKPITVRQCIQSLGKIVPYKPGLKDVICKNLLSVDLSAVSDTMRKLILLDILNVLNVIRKDYRNDEIEKFVRTALSGEILDQKSKMQIQAMFY